MTYKVSLTVKKTDVDNTLNNFFIIVLDPDIETVLII